MKNIFIFRHVPHEGIGSIATYLESLPLTIQYCDLDSHQVPNELPHDLDFVIAMGGPMNVDETGRFPFLLAERRFIRKAIDAGIPTLGICLGAQMIARALGAPVYCGARKEIGWYPVELTQEGRKDALFQSHASSNFVVLQWHGDTFELPDGAVRLARSELFQNQAFRYGKHVYAIQFHFEVTEEMIRDWMIKNADELAAVHAYIFPKDIEDGIRTHEPPMRKLATGIYQELFRSLQPQSQA
jgi:GMP synthase (glutamine-hydrolysing)